MSKKNRNDQSSSKSGSAFDRGEVAQPEPEQPVAAPSPSAPEGIPPPGASSVPTDTLTSLLPPDELLQGLLRVEAGNHPPGEEHVAVEPAPLGKTPVLDEAPLEVAMPGVLPDHEVDALLAKMRGEDPLRELQYRIDRHLDQHPEFRPTFDAIGKKHEAAFYEEIKLLISVGSPAEQQVTQPPDRYEVLAHVRVSANGGLLDLAPGTIISEAVYGPIVMKQLLGSIKVKLRKLPQE